MRINIVCNIPYLLALKLSKTGRVKFNHFVRLWTYDTRINQNQPCFHSLSSLFNNM